MNKTEPFWTTDSPTEPGRYWRRNKAGDVEVVLVEKACFRFYPELVVNEDVWAGMSFVEQSVPVREMGAEWQGPIPQPKER